MSVVKHYVFFSRTLPFHGTGGMEIQIWDLMKNMASSENIKVTVITTTIHNINNSFYKDRINVIPINGVIPRRYTRKWWKLSSEYFDKYLRDDVYCVISVAMGAAGLLFNRNKYPEITIICQSHGTVLSEIISKIRTCNPIQILKCLRQIKYFIRETRIYNNTDKIISVGNIVYKTLSKFPYSLYINSNKLELIENGVDICKFTSILDKRYLRNHLKISNESIIILTVTRLIKQKGIVYALYAIKKLLSNGYKPHFVIIGDGREKERLFSITNKLSLQNHVTFLGECPHTELPKYYQASDIFLFPTLRMEGSPLNILEALACGKPVITSKSLSYSEKLSKNITFINPKDPNDISNALIKVFKEYKNTDYILPDEFSLSAMTDHYLKEFDNVVKENHFKYYQVAH